VIRLFTVLLFSLLTACGGADKTAESKEGVKTNGMVAQELFVQANQQLDSGEFAAAAKLYTRAAKHDPDRWDIPMNMAIAYSRNAQFSEALGAIETSFRNGGDKDPVVFFNLGNIYQERGMYAQAIDAYRSALALEEKPEVDTLVNLGAAYLFIFSYDDAQATFEHTHQLYPDDPRSLHGIGLIYQTKSLYPEALDYYERVHRIDPKFSMAYFNKAWVLAAMDRHDEAIRSMEMYVDRDPNGPYIRRAKNLINTWTAKKSSKS